MRRSQAIRRFGSGSIGSHHGQLGQNVISRNTPNSFNDAACGIGNHHGQPSQNIRQRNPHGLFNNATRGFKNLQGQRAQNIIRRNTESAFNDVQSLLYQSNCNSHGTVRYDPERTDVRMLQHNQNVMLNNTAVEQPAVKVIPGLLDMNITIPRSMSSSPRIQVSRPCNSVETSPHSEKVKLSSCQICRKMFVSTEEFDAHMGSLEHSRNMNVVATVYKSTNNQLLNRVRHHAMKEPVSSSEEPSDTNTCDLCERNYGVMFQASHMASTEHKYYEQLMEEGCKLCGISVFVNRKHYTEHISSLSHKRKRGEDPANSKRQNDVAKMKQQGVVKKAKMEDNSTVSKQLLAKATKAQVDEEPTIEQLEKLTYDPDTAIGADAVISVTGFFCKVCHKFYNNETAAKVTHCKTQAHFDKYYESLKRRLEHRNVEEQHQRSEEAATVLLKRKELADNRPNRVLLARSR